MSCAGRSHGIGIDGRMVKKMDKVGVVLVVARPGGWARQGGMVAVGGQGWGGEDR